MKSRSGGSELWPRVAAMLSRSRRHVAIWVVAASVSAAFASPIVLNQTGVTDPNNLKQIAVAIQSFESANAVFPPEFIARRGPPLLSWRVAVLPYLGLPGLHGKFNTSEPWNSSTNLP